MSQQNISILTLSAVSAGAIAAARFVTPVAAQAGAGENTLGVARFAASAAGERIPVDVLGTAVVEAGAAVAAGDTVKSDGSGRAIPWATSGAKVAVALQSASAPGIFIEVLLIPNAA